MVENEARHLVFLGRSGDSKPEAASMIRRFRSIGVTVTIVKGDVTSEADVQATVKSSQVPIIGVVQGVMALDVRCPLFGFDGYN
jgi:hypothetical protein